ncbi:MAG: carboxypeptidase-like regulatory domain-containing protein [Bacteroidales bacterium]|nr:carboxypeptidase-like regulatory domain-containing protein [Bacteroidales bacterium]
MNTARLPFLILLLMLSAFGLNAQKTRPDQLVQFTGVVVTADSLEPVPFTHIINLNLRRGVAADFYGYFSFVARPGDTIVFSAIGFRKSSYVIPDSIEGDRYSMIKVMTRDTLLLAEAVIYPWPTLEQFKEAFVKMDIPDDDLEIARKNLERSEIYERSLEYPMDGAMNYRNTIDQRTSKLYYYGQLPPNNLLNPFAWAQFIKAWREGKFKRNRE